MQIRIGTSGYSYKEWKGSFYPEDLAQSRMLAYYGERFPTVEINNTFYRMPAAKTLLAWAGEVPASFRFVLKASQRITHQKRLKEAGDAVEYFMRTAGELGDKLGPVLVQLPPNLKKDVPRLVDFLALVPADRRVAIEFRHESWFEDEVYAALRARNAAFVIAESEALAVPLVATADWGYLRLRRQDYGEPELRAWAARLLAQPWREGWVFFKHEDEGKGPQLAAQLGAMVASASPSPSAAP
jgi:uncharacterized protein YecE (DUF72 family)